MSGESTKTLQEVVLEINQGYNNYIEEIKNTITHDDLTTEGYCAPWPDIISVYAVYMTTKSDNPKEAPKPFVNYLPEEVLKELLSLPNQKDRYGIRDAAMLCILYDSGARVQELIDLKIADLRLDTLPTVRLLGKGRRRSFLASSLTKNL